MWVINEENHLNLRRNVIKNDSLMLLTIRALHIFTSSLKIKLWLVYEKFSFLALRLFLIPIKDLTNDTPNNSLLVLPIQNNRSSI